MEKDTITLPAYWAPALINDDYSGLEDHDPDEAARCKEAVRVLAISGWSIVSDVEDSERFTWSYELYDPFAGVSGGRVIDYVMLRSKR